MAYKKKPGKRFSKKRLSPKKAAHLNAEGWYEGE